MFKLLFVFIVGNEDQTSISTFKFHFLSVTDKPEIVSIETNEADERNSIPAGF